MVKKLNPASAVKKVFRRTSRHHGTGTVDGGASASANNSSSSAAAHGNHASSTSRPSSTASMGETSNTSGEREGTTKTSSSSSSLTSRVMVGGRILKKQSSGAPGDNNNNGNTTTSNNKTPSQKKQLMDYKLSESDEVVSSGTNTNSDQRSTTPTRGGTTPPPPPQAAPTAITTKAKVKMSAPPPRINSSPIAVPPILDSNANNNNNANATNSFPINPDDNTPQIDLAYETLIPPLEIIELPRGGVSVHTNAVGNVQFGIPPETIKDSMRLGIAVPSVYIVPVDRFCREMGIALGVNLAEFEFPAYFNYFVQRKRCTLVVDSVDAERNIRRVFSETLLGPAQFRRSVGPLMYEEEDFAPDFPREAIPNFHKELQHFRMMPNGKELVLETLLKFCHFESAPDSNFRDNLGAPPTMGGEGQDDGDMMVEEGDSSEHGMIKSPKVGIEVQSTSGTDSKVVIKEVSTCSNGEGNKAGGESGSSGTSTPAKDADMPSENGMKKKAPKSLTYSQIRWIGDVAKIYPSDAPEDLIAQNKTKRVEIFKMPSGTDYVLHDIDENNVIVGKARFSGNVRVSEGIGVIGLDEEKKEVEEKGDLLDGTSKMPMPMGMPPVPTFNPPSFGVTVLGNSHGFDKSGSTSGYVLWINGRGVMIDPPPYSSATLEREGIRPRTIVGIILTHCHADHDAGAFQKVLTGSPVVVITTPTIYKSFIRKYAALSSLSPALLRHSHRYKPAIIGEPLRFQGASFHFTYTLHAIPCVGFRVDWRGRSMVFTGDHFNNPPALQKLVEKGVLSKARCADLNHLPIQQTDLLLHEAGAPPIHTPLEVLMKLPAEVKKRLYVVHTSALPEGCELRVAPTGTAGTIRLDQIRRNSSSSGPLSSLGGGSLKKRPSIFESNSSSGTSFMKLGESALLEEVDEYSESELFNPTPNAYAHLLGEGAAASARHKQHNEPPPVSLRPTSSSDAWFTLNLLSAVPFLSNLSYTSTMEVLETARVAAYCCNEIVLSANRRKNYLVVVWEGTCMERERIGASDHQSTRSSFNSQVSLDDSKGKAVWYAGDWTGPRILQPEKRLSGDSSSSKTHDIVAMSAEGVKVIMVDFGNLHTVLKNGSALYRKYHLSLSHQHSCKIPSTINEPAASVFRNAVKNLNVIELLESNTGLRKLTAVQKRHLECLVEGPTVYTPGQRLWRAGSTVDKAFIVVAGTVSFVPKRRHGGSAGKNIKSSHRVKQTHETRSFTQNAENIGETMRNDAVKAVRELQASVPTADDDSQSETEDASQEKGASLSNSLTETEDYHRLSRGLQKWAEKHENEGKEEHRKRRGSSSTDNTPEVSLHDFCDATIVNEDNKVKPQVISRTDSALSTSMTDVSTGMSKRQSTKNRFANKVLGRLYNRRAFASGLVFSRGHFLGDIEKMVEGLLSSAHTGEDAGKDSYDEFAQFGFGDNEDGLSMDTMTIHELEGGQHTTHTSTLAAGKDGCVVLILPKASLIPFLDAHPGLLLSLLGTQVVV